MPYIRRYADALLSLIHATSRYALRYAMLMQMPYFDGCLDAMPLCRVTLRRYADAVMADASARAVADMREMLFYCMPPYFADYCHIEIIFA